MGVYGNIWVPDNNDVITSLSANLATMASSIDALTDAIQADIIDRSPKYLYLGTGGTGTSSAASPAITILSSGTLALGASPRKIMVVASALFSGASTGGVRSYVQGTPLALTYMAQGSPGNTDGSRIVGSVTMPFTHSGNVNYTLIMIRATGSGTINATQGLLSVLDLGPA